MPVTTVAVLGSTGSIGTQTLEVVADQPDEFDVVALGAARSVDLLLEQATRFRPEVVAIADASLAASVVAGVPPGTEVLAGPDAMADAAVIAEDDHVPVPEGRCPEVNDVGKILYKGEVHGNEIYPGPRSVVTPNWSEPRLFSSRGTPWLRAAW